MPRFQLSRASRPIDVYTSNREAIPVAPGDVIETEDERLLVRLRSDTQFEELTASPVEATVDSHPVEQFVTEVKAEPETRKRGPGRPKKVRI